jgi:rhomboid protease GluP
MNLLPESSEEVPQFYIRLSSPLVTRGLLGILLALFVVSVLLSLWIFGSWTSLTRTDLRVLILLGAKVDELVAEGQLWRLLTAVFLHSGVIHLLFNLYALYTLGPLLEGYIGHLRFLAVFFISGLYGSLLSYAFSGSISVGASGAIFGLLGATTVFFLRYRQHFGDQGRAVLQNMLLVLALNLLIGFSASFIDNWGHIGGLIGGGLGMAGILPQYRPPAGLPGRPLPLEIADRRLAELAWVGVCLILFWVGVGWVTSVRFPLL